MRNGVFQLNKLQRFIRTHGQEFQFSTPGMNEFQEPNGETVSHSIKGVFHETTGYATQTTSDASTIRKKSSPMIMVLWEEAQKLSHTDKLVFNGKSYRVNEIKNISEANLVADISLEEVQA